MILVATANGVSRLHSSRRVFQELHKIGTKVPVIHHMVFDGDGWVKDDIVIQSGAQAGGLLCDGRELNDINDVASIIISYSILS